MENKNITPDFPYYFTERQFKYKDIDYKVVLTPFVYSEGDGLDFSGNYLGILISSYNGTTAFELERDESVRWVSIPKAMDPGLIDILDSIIQDIRSDDTKRIDTNFGTN